MLKRAKKQPPPEDNDFDDMPPLTFVVDIVPPTATFQAKRPVVNKKTGRTFIAKNAAGLATEATFLQMLTMGPRPARPYSGPIQLDIAVVWPHLKSAKKHELAEGAVPHLGRPDLDNFVKQLQDCLVTSKHILKDQEIVGLRVTKYRGHNPGVYCRISRYNASWWRRMFERLFPEIYEVV